MTHRHAGEQLQRRVVRDLTVLDDAAVAVRRVRAQADVGEQQQLGKARAQCAESLLHDTVLGPGTRRLVVLVLGHAEQQQCRDTSQRQRLRLAQQAVDRVTAERGQLLVDQRLGSDEHRHDEVVYAQTRLADEIAQCGRAA